MKNEYEIRGDETVIFIRRRTGKWVQVLIDTVDVPLLADKIQGSVTVRRDYVWTAIGPLHRVLMGEQPKEYYVVDHIFHDPLKNRVSRDLRWLTHSDNCKHMSRLTEGRFVDYPSAIYPARSIWHPDARARFELSRPTPSQEASA